MEKIDRIPDEAIRASFALGDDNDDGTLDVTVLVFVGGSEEPAFDKPVPLPTLDLLEHIPGLRLLARHAPDIIPEELARFDIAIGDADDNGVPDVSTAVFFGGDEEPRIYRLREVTKEEAFDVMMRVVGFLRGRGFTLGLAA